VGPVEKVVLLRDKSGRCKGFGYIEFSDLESIPKALLLNGQNLCMKHAACTCSGFPLLVKPSEAERNYAAVAEAHGGTASHQNAERRVYVGNLPPAVTEGDMRQLAETIGEERHGHWHPGATGARLLVPLCRHHQSLTSPLSSSSSS